jgi:hypothetical protein
MTDEIANTQRHLPDPEICRTMYLGQALNLSECLVENPDSCEFAARFYASVFCWHPERRTFEKADPP